MDLKRLRFGVRGKRRLLPTSTGNGAGRIEKEANFYLVAPSLLKLDKVGSGGRAAGRIEEEERPNFYCHPHPFPVLVGNSRVYSRCGF